LPDPATFRPQGLATLSADYSLRARAGLFSYRQRSWDFALRSFLLAEGIRRVSAGMNPPTVFPVGSPALLRWAGPTGRGSWAFTLPGVPGTGRRISAASTGCSLGLHPHRACGSKRRTGFRPCLLPRAFGDQLHSGSTAPRSLKRLRPRFIRHPENREPHKATLSGFWHRIIRERLNESRPGYGFTLRRVVHHCRPPALLGRSPRSTGAAQVRSGVPSISLRFRPGPVRLSLGNLVGHGSPRPTILMPGLARTPDLHRAPAGRNPDLKPSRTLASKLASDRPRPRL
jgi:hypothetical protein